MKVKEPDHECMSVGARHPASIGGLLAPARTPVKQRLTREDRT